MVKVCPECGYIPMKHGYDGKKRRVCPYCGSNLIVSDLQDLIR